MRTLKNYVLLLLVATTLGGAVLAWRQYGELVELRAAAMNRDERADLQKRVWDLEKLNRELQEQLARQGAAGGADRALAGGDDARASDGRRDGRATSTRDRGDSREWAAGAMQQANAVRELMNKPEVQAMMTLQQKAAIDQRYAALFKNLNLPPDQVDKLKTLLVERATTMQDVMAAAREQGVNPRENPDAFRRLVADAENQVNTSIKAAIGESGFAQLTNYEQTLPQRNLVNDLQQRLSYTSMPLTAAQAEQMVQILAADAPTRTDRTAGAATPAGGDGGRGPGSFGPPGGFGRGPDVGALVAGVLGGGGPEAFRGGGTVPVTQAAIAQAQTVLAPPQLTALQQIQQQQQAQQQLRQLVNETLSANQPPQGATKGRGDAATTPPRKRGGGG